MLNFGHYQKRRSVIMCTYKKYVRNKKKTTSSRLRCVSLARCESKHATKQIVKNDRVNENRIFNIIHLKKSSQQQQYTICSL